MRRRSATGLRSPQATLVEGKRCVPVRRARPAAPAPHRGGLRPEARHTGAQVLLLCTPRRSTPGPPEPRRGTRRGPASQVGHRHHRREAPARNDQGAEVLHTRTHCTAAHDRQEWRTSATGDTCTPHPAIRTATDGQWCASVSRAGFRSTRSPAGSGSGRPSSDAVARARHTSAPLLMLNARPAPRPHAPHARTPGAGPPRLRTSRGTPGSSSPDPCDRQVWCGGATGDTGTVRQVVRTGTQSRGYRSDTRRPTRRGHSSENGVPIVRSMRLPRSAPRQEPPSTPDAVDPHHAASHDGGAAA